MTQITIDRALVEQALEALEGFAYHGKAAGWPETITNLRAALAQPAPEPECTWHQDGDSDSGTYSTSCGHYFVLEDGTPEDNEMAHCCYCGKRLAQELIAEETK
jgi:hypothetical protein